MIKSAFRFVIAFSLNPLVSICGVPHAKSTIAFDEVLISQFRRLSSGLLICQMVLK